MFSLRGGITSVLSCKMKNPRKRMLSGVPFVSLTGYQNYSLAGVNDQKKPPLIWGAP